MRKMFFVAAVAALTALPGVGFAHGTGAGPVGGQFWYNLYAHMRAAHPPVSNVATVRHTGSFRRG